MRGCSAPDGASASPPEFTEFTRSLWGAKLDVSHWVGSFRLLWGKSGVRQQRPVSALAPRRHNEATTLTMKVAQITKSESQTGGL